MLGGRDMRESRPPDLLADRSKIVAGTARTPGRDGVGRVSPRTISQGLALITHTGGRAFVRPRSGSIAYGVRCAYRGTLRLRLLNV
ncbi:hypothetical protein EVAR_35604_1 [Eumeta japonica]|uniref:Uncharacterized protein n=1 Tax=Eumeta variegata TaxID=151549 RepID=A0A4C1WD61_EUMVA|nr:hypothetical protein EVAR_35604_1 [Eumeta japonica]